MNKIAIIEALLFVAGDEGLSLNEISELTNISVNKLENILLEMIEKYNNDVETGITIINTADKYQLVTKNKYADYVKSYAQSPFSQKLSRALLETLAIVAYKQPITRVEVEEIRGVQVANNLQKLRSRQLIKEMGRLDRPGRPLLYGTTDFFLDYFGIRSLKELPELIENDNTEGLTNLFSKSFHQPIDESEENEEKIFKNEDEI